MKLSSSTLAIPSLFLILAAACGSGDSNNPSGSGGSTGGSSGGSGGAVSTGGSATSGGTPSSGGSASSGGTKASGGVASSGGSTAAGGSVGSGGTPPGNGGAVGSGGSTSSGSGGRSGTGGAASSGGSAASGGAIGSGGNGPGGNIGDGPCDVYAAASTPCVAAYSMVRALTKTYSGPLYQVRKNSSSTNTGTGGTTSDIGMLQDGYADAASQDAFCSGTVCTVSRLYDQSGNGNHLTVAKKGRTDGGQYADKDDFESTATKGPITAGGHKVYSLKMAAREGYRLAAVGKGMSVGNTENGVYMLADGTNAGTACCWDFGNVSPDPMRYGVMNTLFLGTGFWGKGAGSGPWFLGDFEGGVWAGGSGASTAVNSNNPSMKVPFAFGILKTSPGKYALRMADLQTANDLTTAWDGNSPKAWANDGGILLGIGGDNSNNSWGTFFEGAITAKRPSDATDLAVFKNVKAVGYSK